MGIIGKSWIGLGVLGAVACADDSRMHAEFQAGPTITLAMLTMTVQDGQREWTWTGADFSPRPGSPSRIASPEHETGSSGTLTVTYRLQDGSGVISEGDVDIPLKQNWHYTVLLYHTSYDPTFEAQGDVGHKRFNLAPAYQSLGRQFIWVVWSGQRNSGGVY